MIGIIAIGRNEGERLRGCLTAASSLAPRAPLIYVDSGSSDGSVALAESLGASVVRLDVTIPFTAARARNAGLAELLEIAPDVRYVQFIDGDCELRGGWLDAAATYLDKHADAAVVCGRRRERYPAASIYNRLADMEWNTPIGDAKSCGGDAMFRLNPLRRVGGYNADVIAGEEPELCVRLRALGLKVVRLDHEMTLHDAAMSRFGQWWKRNVRAGHAYAEGFDRHGAPPERFAARQVRSNWTWAVVLPAASLLASAMVGRIAPRWAPIPSLVLVLLLVMLATRVARHRRQRGDSMRDALAYGAFTAIGKLPQMVGQWKYRIDKRSGRRATIIEYKGAA